MGKTRIRLVVGCIVKKDNEILLVKHNYGYKKGKWDFIKGHVELDEDIENAAIREVMEEASIRVKPLHIIGVRNMLRNAHENEMINDIAIIWLMEYEMGEPKPDGRELCETKFWKIDDVLNSDEIGGWTKDLLKSVLKDKGLSDSKYKPSGHPAGTIFWKSYTI